MNLFLWNFLLALVWALATGLFTVSNLLAGFLLGYFVLWFAGRALGPSSYFVRVPRVLVFFAFYLRELVLANLRVAYDVMTPKHYMKPGVIAVPLDTKTPLEITLLANLITLTPGTLALDLSADNKVLFIHAMYLDEQDADRLRRQIKDGLERRVLEVLR